MTPVNQFIYQIAADENFDPNDYFQNHKEELESAQPPSPSVYAYRNETGRINTTKGLFQNLLAKHLVLPAAKAYADDPEWYRTTLVKAVKHSYVKNGKKVQKPLVFKRIQIDVNGISVDVLLVGRKENINNRRWILQSNPNLAPLEQMMGTRDILRRTKNLNANYLLFNYPGVGASGGTPNQQQMIDTYEAMLKFLEDPEQVGAREIIGWGTSIGGAVQGEAILNHSFNKNLRYLFVKDQTFARFKGLPKELIKEALNEAAGKILGPIGNALIDRTQWSFNNLPGSNLLEEMGIHEVIIQNASVEDPTDPSQILGDGIISSIAALASQLLINHWNHKTFVGVSQEHVTSYSREEEARITQAVIKGLFPPGA